MRPVIIVGSEEEQKTGRGFDNDKGSVAYLADAEITTSAKLIELVRSDLPYAGTMMDIAEIRSWLEGAEFLLRRAKLDDSYCRYEAAVDFARAAGRLAVAAGQEMAEELGDSVFPFYRRRFHQMYMRDAIASQGQPT